KRLEDVRVPLGRLREAQVYTDEYVHVAQGDDVDKHDGVGDGRPIHLRPEGRARPQAAVEREMDRDLGFSQIFDKVHPVEPPGEKRKDGNETGIPRRHGDMPECVEFGCPLHHRLSPLGFSSSCFINLPISSYHSPPKGQMSLPGEDNITYLATTIVG